jgi:hypothetical protein
MINDPLLVGRIDQECAHISQVDYVFESNSKAIARCCG